MDAFKELVDVTMRLKSLTRHHAGVVSVHINAGAWEGFTRGIRASETFQRTTRFHIEDGQGSDGLGRRFFLCGVEFCDYDHVTGLPTPR